MPQPVLVLVTCASRKFLPAPAERMLRNARGDSVADLARGWVSQLVRSGSPRLPAAELYAGNYWSDVRSLPGYWPRGQIEVWICSAGYGLLSWRTAIGPYSATFSPGHPDSLPGRIAGPTAGPLRRSWWAALAEWEGPEPGLPRTIEQLVVSRPGWPVLVVASSGYLGAFADDLRASVPRLDNPDELAIISAGTRDLPGLTRHLIPCDARLRRLVGGPMTSLNARIAGLALADAAPRPLGAAGLRAWSQGLLDGLESRPAVARARIGDDQVLEYIRGELLHNPGVSRSTLLQRLRDSGRACEQARFAALFLRARGGIHGGR